MFDLFNNTGIATAANRAAHQLVESLIKLRSLTNNFTVEIEALSPGYLTVAYVEASAIQRAVATLGQLGLTRVADLLKRHEEEGVAYANRLITSFNGIIDTSGAFAVMRQGFEAEDARAGRFDEETGLPVAGQVASATENALAVA